MIDIRVRQKNVDINGRLQIFRPIDVTRAVAVQEVDDFQVRKIFDERCFSDLSKAVDDDRLDRRGLQDAGYQIAGSHKNHDILWKFFDISITCYGKFLCRPLPERPLSDACHRETACRPSP